MEKEEQSPGTHPTKNPPSPGSSFKELSRTKTIGRRLSKREESFIKSYALRNHFEPLPEIAESDLPPRTSESKQSPLLESSLQLDKSEASNNQYKWAHRAANAARTWFMTTTTKGSTKVSSDSKE